MLKILALCPDEETRANFFVDIAEAGSKIRSTPGSEVPTKEAEASRPGRMGSGGKLTSRFFKPGSNRR